MRSLKLLILVLFSSLLARSQYVQPMNYSHYSFPYQVNIGGITGKVRLTNASAYLEIGDSANSKKGLLFPRGKTDSIASPVKGLVIFDNPTLKLKLYNGTAWVDLGSAIDTSSISNRINQKLNSSDTTGLSNRINQLFARRDTIVISQPDSFHIVICQPSISVCDTLVFFLGTGSTIDTAGLSSRIDAKLDSAMLRSGTTVDTLVNYYKGSQKIGGYIDRKDGLVSGGVVTNVSGLIFDVSPAVYYINGVRYTSPGGQITLNASDPTNPRIDVIALNSSGNVVNLTGTASINPAEPQADPATQLALTSINIAAGATTPTGITTTTVYNENIEWAVSTIGTITANPASTAQAYNGTKSIAVSSFNSGSAIRFVNSTPINVSSVTTNKFWIRLTSALNNQNISVQFYKAGVSVSNSIASVFTKSTTNAWQSATQNISQVTFSQSSFDEVRLTFSGNSSNTLYLDYIQLQGGLTNGGGFVEVDPFYNANGVPKTRTLTINGTTYDLSANRSWTISSTPAADQTVTATANGQTAFTFTGLPATSAGFTLEVNGGVFSASDFTLSGNTITVTATNLAIGDKVTVHFK